MSSDPLLAPRASEPAPESPREALSRARRVVVKAGTNVLCKANGELAQGRFHSLVEELVELRRRGLQVILVSSGAIGLGVERLGLAAKPDSLADKQACAAIGQARMMTAYQDAFDRCDIPTAQILLTEADLSHRDRYLNLRNTLSRLLELGAVPIINENDTVSTLEIETRLDGKGQPAVFGDNDVLSALVASKLGADVLIILSDVDGLHDRPPEKDPAAKRIDTVAAIDAAVEALAEGGSRRGRGGMRTKLRAAKIATHGGTPVVIASGSRPGVLHDVLAGKDVGTIFLPRKALSSRQRWIAYASSVSGRVRVQDGARAALVERRASLLFAGVTAIEDEFEEGAIVGILDAEGREFARGVANYAAAAARALIGRKSAEIPALRGPASGNAPLEFIHRDNIVILEAAREG